MCVSGAWALTCAISYKIPSLKKPSVQKFDAQWRQQIDTQLREGFDAQTRRQFGAAEIVAEAKVVGLGEVLRSGWSSSQLVEVIVTRYLRAPLTKQARDRYHITAAPGALKVKDTVLFFAHAEPEKTWQARLVPLDPKHRERIHQIPRSWTERIWQAHGACTNTVYQLAASENEYLVHFVRQLANDKLAPATLRLSFSTRGSVLKSSSEVSVGIVANSGDAGRTVSVTANGTDLDLRAGRYQLLWPELPGYRAACFAEHEKPDCELNLVAGGSTQVHVEYQPTAQVSLVPVAPSATPIMLLGELEWQRIDGPKTEIANDLQVAIQDTYFWDGEFDQLDDGDGHPIVPGRYQLNWVVKSYQPSLQRYDTCVLLRTEKITLRWRMGSGEFASEHDLPAGHSLVFAEIPQSQTVNLEFTKAEESRVDISVKPRCADIFSVSVSGDSPLKAVAFRGQQYELEYGCYSCDPRQERARRLMHADRDLVLDLK